MRLRANAFRISFFAMGLGLRALTAGLLIEGLRLLMTPVGYWRFLPFSFVWDEFRKQRNPRVLDASSPKLLSLFMASQTSDRVYATDLDDRKIFARWKPLAGAAGLDNYTVEYQDARNLSYPDCFFDFVYSISVIEHIPGDGDREALAEFRRVLKPGGTLVIEVPYRRKREEVFMPFDSKGQAVSEPQFYERHYDAESLKERLEVPGLTVRKKVLLGERLALDPWLQPRRLPRVLRAALLPLEPGLAAVNCWARADEGREGHPGSAVLVYQKSRQ